MKKYLEKGAKQYRAMQGALLAASIAVSVPVLAALPKPEAPSEGKGKGLMEDIQGYLYDGFGLGGKLLAAAAFVVVCIAAISTFAEAKQKGEWQKFGITMGVGVILVVGIIWLTNESTDILKRG